MKRVFLLLCCIMEISCTQAQVKDCLALSLGGWLQGEIPGIYYQRAIGSSFVAEISPSFALRNKADDFVNRFTDGSAHPYLSGDEVYSAGYSIAVGARQYFNQEPFNNFFIGSRVKLMRYNFNEEYILNSVDHYSKKFNSNNIFLMMNVGYSKIELRHIEGNLQLGIRHINCEYYKINTLTTGIETLTPANLSALRFNVLLDLRFLFDLGGWN